MTQLDRTAPAVGNIPAPRRPPESLGPWTPTPPSGIRWLDAGSPETPTPPRPSRRRVGWLAGAVAVAVLAVVGTVVAVLLAGRTMTVQGSVVVAVSGTTLPGAPCTAPPVSGATLSMFDSDGTLVGSAPVARTGYAVDRWATGTPFADGCRFDVLFTDVPATDPVYRVGVGRTVADTTRFSRRQLETTGASITYGR